MRSEPHHGGSTLEVVSRLKSFRDAGLEIFTALEADYRKQGDSDAANKIQAWSNDWLSVLGVHRGLTGLAADYAMNYLGRASYHDNNGPLISSIKQVGSSSPSNGQKWDFASVDVLIKNLRKVCKEGKSIFLAGSLQNMLQELDVLLALPRMHRALGDAVTSNNVVQDAFAYFSGPSPSSDATKVEVSSHGLFR
eukprot:CAMPEP_0197664082 /NCGR_PEP_ID=MMETSP1338-20131121/58420_1 /TAXON_ID=43686 ORGANISM="Pelagodinium beii, Strain RCC1491" /NCGR_SAMPLE_ID=MMETSP1338 /ASSEMBLY_ACC=CAM_ASM_000754 /LENGTH=193 /DNA_ID=CAMNT_0043242649 /DNA_START=189 /DNA_END=770 /DNA_ORIENTATION=-